MYEGTEGNGKERGRQTVGKLRYINSLPFIREQSWVADGVLDQHSELRGIDPWPTMAAGH